MSEELIMLENDNINAEDLEQTIEAGETTEIVEVEAIEEIEIEVDEAVGWVGGDSTRHYSLSGRDESDQHPIGAITGLRAELDKIESLQTVYSDKKQQADYYKWQQDDNHEFPANPHGLFVSIYPETNNIQICNGDTDVIGVTVAEAAFVGGQEYIKADDGIKAGRDGNYCLVVYSGIANVMCETTVNVGDYVVSNSRGEAKKSDGDYGYLVTALSEINGIQHAIISLNIPSTLVQKTADSVKDLSKRMSNAEHNITSAINVANSAYALAKDTTENAEIDSEYLKDKIAEVLDKMDNVDEAIDNLGESINNACENAALARTIADNAVSEARQIGDDAYASANEAIAAIKDIGAGSTSWSKRLDAYSVGEYSQAYGLTWEQAKEALPIGIIHIPTVIHTETYDTYTQEFSIGYYYEWNGEQWSPSYSSAVNFSSVYIEGTNQTPFWVVTDADVEYNDITYNLGYLYKWESVAWSMTGASVAENTLARAVSTMHQTANELSMEVSDVKGSVAALNTRVDEKEATIQGLARWTGSEEGKYNIATTKVSADDEGASIALVVVKDGEDIELSGARIILNDSKKGSYIQLTADNINLDGYVTFTNLNSHEDGKTFIDGANIITNTIKAEQINTEGLHADYIEVLNDNNEIIFKADKENNFVQINAANIDGKLTADQIDVDSLSALSGDVGTLTAGIIQSSNYVSGESGLKLDLTNGTADITGRFTATEGTIGGWNIDGTKLGYKENATDTSYYSWIAPEGHQEGTDTTSYAVKIGSDFKVTKAGKVIAYNIEANGGKIAGWNASASTTQNGVVGKYLRSTDGKVGMWSASSSTTETINFWAGGTVSNSNSTTNNPPPFFVTNKGNLTAVGANLVDAKLTGNISIVKQATTSEGDYLSLNSIGGLQLRNNNNESSEKYKQKYTSLTSEEFVFDRWYPEGGGARDLSYRFTIYPIENVVNIGILNQDVGVNGYCKLIGTWNTDSGAAVTSDRNLKHNIELLDNKYTILFDNLIATRFKYNNGTSNRYHTGFIAQDVKQAIEKAGLDTNEFASYVTFGSGEEQTCGLRYEEFIPLCVDQIQKLKARVAELENKLIEQ